MKHLGRHLLALLVACATLLGAGHILAGTEQLRQALQALRTAQPPSAPEALEQMAAAEGTRALDVIDALKDGRLAFDSSGTAWIESKGRRYRAIDASPGSPEGRLEPFLLDNTMRRRAEELLSHLRLRSADVRERRDAAREIAQRPEASAILFLRQQVAQERDITTKESMELAIAKLDIADADPAVRIRAANALAKSSDISMREQLEALLASDSRVGSGERDPEVRKAMKAAAAAISLRELITRSVANFIYGLSLGSILLLAALGLAITFGLMKVINMAHGEMLMLGAYATYLTQSEVQARLPQWLDYYLAFAIPIAFLTTFAIGFCLERLVVSKLYGRPLETLLATWGLSLLLIQITRTIFGAQNVTVANPSWLVGGWELMPSIVVPYSRVAVLGFTAVVVGFVWYMLQRTGLGLKLRAITQNRDMAAALGIQTRTIDSLAFSLGSGVAGLGGVALSQLGNVGPELGQQHIIDSFMVVVLGGVGNVVGSVLGAMGLGITSKFLEPSLGAVLGKIAILVAIILFIQWRPQGMFALKGRVQEE